MFDETGKHVRSSKMSQLTVQNAVFKTNNVYNYNDVFSVASILFLLKSFSMLFTLDRLWFIVPGMEWLNR